jgi:hypothetical protein
MNTNNPQIASSLLLQYVRGFHAEVNSPYNEWVTGEKVGHSPTWDEKLIHFITSGGVRDFRKRFKLVHPEAPFAT